MHHFLCTGFGRRPPGSQWSKRETATMNTSSLPQSETDKLVDFNSYRERALTGAHPFAGQWLGMLMVRICTEAFTPASTVAPYLSAEVDKFFERALAKDPDKRFRNAREFANAFVALTEHRERSKAKILVVDDEPDVELLVKQRFRPQIKKSIYEFVFASDGLNALEKLRRHDDIDVIMTDINRRCEGP